MCAEEGGNRDRTHRDMTDNNPHVHKGRAQEALPARGCAHSPLLLPILTD